MSDQNKSNLHAKRAELEDITSWFDSDEFSIELALEKFSLAEKLAKEIEKELNEYKNQINIIKQRFDKDAV